MLDLAKLFRNQKKRKKRRGEEYHDNIKTCITCYSGLMSFVFLIQFMLDKNKKKTDKNHTNSRK